jgi:hypothetical protein
MSVPSFERAYLPRWMDTIVHQFLVDIVDIRVCIIIIGSVAPQMAHHKGIDMTWPIMIHGHD